MTEHPTVWEPIPEATSFRRGPNPKLRIVAMFVGLALMLGFVLYVTFMPREYSCIVSIESIPEGASISVEGIDRGTTPMKLSLAPSSYSLTLTKEGFNTLATTLEVSKEGETFSFDLTKTEDAVSITTIPEGASVYVDNNFVGQSNLKYRRDIENIHRIKVSLPGFRDQEKMVDFSKERDIIFNLEKSFYKVKITTIPKGSVVYIDENYKGETPIEIDLTEGDHDLRLVLSGRKSIIKKIRVTTPLDLEYSFESDGFDFETMIGEDSAPGAKIYMFHIKDGTVNFKIQPLYVGKSPVTRSTNDIMTYITADLATKQGLLVANHSMLGSYVGMFDLDEGGKPTKPKLVMQLSGESPDTVLGQPVESISYNNIITDATPSIQDATNNRRFKQVEQGGSWKLIDRDNYPLGQVQLDGKPDKTIISPTEDRIVAIIGGKCSVYDLGTGKLIKTMKGTGAFFTLDGKTVVTYTSSAIETYTFKNGETTASNVKIKGVLVPVASDFAMDVDKGKIISFINIKTGQKETWNSIFTENPFEPENVVIRNVAGHEKIIVLGKIYGIQAMVKVDTIPSILYLWVPENAVPKLTSPHL